jgi:hypothetical protein
MNCQPGSGPTVQKRKLLHPTVWAAVANPKKELPRCGSPLQYNIMYNLSAKFLKLPLSGPLSVNDENAQNILSGKF